MPLFENHPHVTVRFASQKKRNAKKKRKGERREWDRMMDGGWR